MWSVFVHKKFWRKILLLRENILQKDGEVEEISTKEYQYKNSYQGKYCDPKNIYEPWLLEGTIRSYTKHLFVFNFFGKKNNYERIRF